MTKKTIRLTPKAKSTIILTPKVYAKPGSINPSQVAKGKSSKKA